MNKSACTLIMLLTEFILTLRVYLNELCTQLHVTTTANSALCSKSHEFLFLIPDACINTVYCAKYTLCSFNFIQPLLRLSPL